MQQQKDNQTSTNVNKIRMTEVKTDGMIHDVAYDFSGNKVAFATSEGSIEIQVNSFKSEHKDNSQDNSFYKIDFIHHGPVWQLSWSNPKYKNLLASCSFDRTICIFSEKNGRYEKLVQFDPNIESVQTIAFSYKKLILAAGTSDGIVKLYFMKKGGQIDKKNDWDNFQIQEHESCVNSITWLRSKEQILASGDNDGKIIIWKVEGLEKLQLRKLTRYICDGWVRSIDWAPQLYEQTYLLAVGLEKHKTIIFFLNKDFSEESIKEIQTYGPCWKVSWSPLGNQIAIATTNEKQDPDIIVYTQNQKGEFLEI